MSARPGWLTAISAIAIVFGTIGILSSILGAIGQYFSSSMQEAVQKVVQASQPNQAMPPDVKALQEEMTAMMQELQGRWQTVTVALLVCNAAVSSLLVAGGIGTLRLAEWGRRLLIAALAATILFEIGQVVTQLLIQNESKAAAREYMGKIMNASLSQANQNLPAAQRDSSMRIMSATADVFFLLAIAMALAWALVKVSAYAAAIHYLHRPQIRALVANRSGPADVQAVIAET
jgi:hypothetical protein